MSEERLKLENKVDEIYQAIKSFYEEYGLSDLAIVWQPCSQFDKIAAVCTSQDEEWSRVFYFSREDLSYVAIRRMVLARMEEELNFPIVD